MKVGSCTVHRVGSIPDISKSAALLRLVASLLSTLVLKYVSTYTSSCSGILETTATHVLKNREVVVVVSYLEEHGIRVCGNKSWPTTRNTDKTHETKQNHVLDCGMTTMVVYELRKGCICDTMNNMSVYISHQAYSMSVK